MSIPLATTHYLWRAHIVRGVLECHGVPASVAGEASALLYGPAPAQGVRVLIREEDFEDAIEVLRAAPEALADDNTDAAEPAAPIIAPDAFSIGVAIFAIIVIRSLLLALAVTTLPEYLQRSTLAAWLGMDPLSREGFQRDVALMLGSVAVASIILSLALRPLNTRHRDDYLALAGMLLFLAFVSEPALLIAWIISSL